MHKNILKIQHELLPLLQQVGYEDGSRIAQEITSYLQELLGDETSNWEHGLVGIRDRLENHEPWEYIRGWAQFRGHKLSVSKDVLIPRLETEVLVGLVLGTVHKAMEINQAVEIVDVGTGSGAIAISLAKEIPTARIQAADTSLEALDVAQGNAQGTNILFTKTNLIEGLKLDKKAYKIIVANLPYIPTKDYLGLDQSVIKYEPRLALDGGEDGLKQIKELVEQVRGLKGDKTLLLEFDPSTTKRLQGFLTDEGLIHTFHNDQFDRKRFVTVSF